MSRRDYNRWFSQYRDGINAYRQTLQSDPHFKTVSVPVGDWPVPGRTIFGYSNGRILALENKSYISSMDSFPAAVLAWAAVGLFAWIIATDEVEGPYMYR